MNRERIEDEIESLTIAAEVLFEILANRIGEVLQAGRREQTQDTVRQMRLDSRTGDSTLASLESIRSTPTAKPLHKAKTTKANIGKAQKGYWAKMTPKQRQNEMRRRQAKWSTSAKKAWGGPRKKMKKEIKKKISEAALRRHAEKLNTEAHSHVHVGGMTQ